MRIAFRTDGGIEGQGLGHLMRCLAIAEALNEKKIESLFICHASATTNDLVQSCGYQIQAMPPTASEDEDLALTLAASKGCGWIVIDSYSLTSEYLNRLHLAGKKVLFLDDQAAQGLPVDFVIGNGYAISKDYATILAPFTKLLGGPAYVPLRKEFRNVSPHIVQNEVKEILITFGGEDSNNMTQKVVSALCSYPKPISLHILLGAAYRYETELHRTLSQSHIPHSVHRNVKGTLPMMSEADIAITASGTTLWELASAEIPMIIVQTADNQSKLSKYFADHQLGFVLGKYTNEALYKAMDTLYDPLIRRGMSRACHALVDGRGAERIANILTSKASEIALKDVDPSPDSEESQQIWKWRNDETTRKMSTHSQEITWDEHKRWYQKTIHDKKHLLLLAYYHERPVGMIRFDLLENRSAEININLAPSERSQGLGTSILIAANSYGFQQLDLLKIDAKVKRDNLPSQKAFLNAGYHLEKEIDSLQLFTLAF